MLVENIRNVLMKKEITAPGEMAYVFVINNNTGQQEKLVVCSLFKHKNGCDLFIDYEGIYNIASNHILEICEDMESNGWQFCKGIDHEELYQGS